jgi:predicted nuclease of predicted toxin-antitoxin system
MTLLIDNQLPVALARFISDSGWPCFHVRDVGLDSAHDAEIWNYSIKNQMTIVTKDEDFQAMANRQGSIPPQIVWVRIGNCRKAQLLASFAKILPLLKVELATGVSVVELR